MFKFSSRLTPRAVFTPRPLATPRASGPIAAHIRAEWEGEATPATATAERIARVRALTMQ